MGDNGQGKTTFLRTVCGSLEPTEGEVIWGYGCQVGIYAQHVYTSLPNQKTVMEYLEYEAAPKTNTQQIKDVAGSFLFSGELIEKPIRVLSGGERARLVLAGLLLQKNNILVLDEPGNHLDVESVEALAEALIGYSGTVIFTSHDRHFMHRVATNVVEVRAGKVASYPGNYEAYWRLRRERYEQQVKAYEAQQEYIEKQEEYIRRVHYGQLHKQAASRQKQLDRMERVTRPEWIDSPRMPRTLPPRSSFPASAIVASAENCARSAYRP